MGILVVKRFLQHFDVELAVTLSNRLTYFIVFTLLVIHSGLLAHTAMLHSPTLNEPAHLVAGLTHWKFGRFEVYRVNPPLTHYVAALPVLIAGYKEDWSGYYDSPEARPEFRMGADFIKANGARSIWLFTIARWAFIPFSLTGAIFCFLWSRDLWGSNLAGLISVWFWSCEPFLLGHAELITPDVPATALGLGATYLFWRWLRNPSWTAAFAAGVCLGLAEVTKTSWIILYGLWPLLFTFWLVVEFRVRRSESPQNSHSSVTSRIVQFSMILLTSLYFLNLFFIGGSSDSFTKLKDFQFVSKSLNGLNKSGYAGNRFSNSWLGELPIPLPKQYLSGIDLQRKDFEDYGHPSYLRGEWKQGGWWYYYLYGLAAKTTHGLQVALALAIFTIFWQYQKRTPPSLADQKEGARFLESPLNRPQNTQWRVPDLVVLLIPPLFVLIMVSSQLGFNHHVRYVMPVLGYAFVLTGVLASLWGSVNSKNIARMLALLTSSLAVFSVPISLWMGFPHQLAYFNALSGGTYTGYRNLLYSNLDWGQDLLFLKDWIDANPQARPLQLEASNLYGAEHVGLDISLQGDSIDERKQPLWLAVSVNDLQKRGLLCPVTGEAESLKHDHLTEQLQNAREVVQIGPTIRIFFLDKR